MKNETSLTGKWQFIGANRYINQQWQSTDYVEGMIWEFSVQYFSDSITIGSIVETTPANTPIEMAYAHNKRDNLLKIDTSVDCSITTENSISEVDLYIITVVNDESGLPTIRLSIHDKPYAQPYFQYILQRI